MKTKIIALLFLLITAVNAYALISQPLEKLFLMAGDYEGTFLGSFEKNKFSSDSIFNEFGSYGSELSDYSHFNKLANHPPFIVDRYGNINIRKNGVTDDTHEVAMRLKARWNILNK